MYTKEKIYTNKKKALMGKFKTSFCPFNKTITMLLCKRNKNQILNITHTQRAGVCISILKTLASCFGSNMQEQKCLIIIICIRITHNI